jgi:hypothetical protein
MPLMAILYMEASRVANAEVLAKRVLPESTRMQQDQQRAQAAQATRIRPLQAQL